MRIKKNDTVIVISGRSKGKIGKVLSVVRESERAFVEKVNMVKRHCKPNQQNRQGGIIEKEASIHLSNLMLLDPKDKKPTRISYKIAKDGSKNRVSKRSGEVIK